MKHRISSPLIVALCGLAPAVFGNLLGWSAWLWGFLSAVTVSGALLLVMTVLSGVQASAEQYEAEEFEQPAAPTEPPYQETRVVDAPLPSATDGYDFLFSAVVWWRPVPGHADRSDSAFPALAVSSIVSRATEVVRHEEPGRASYARYLLEGALGVPFLERSGRVKALAVDVKLALAPADSERLRKLKDLQKDEEVWEYERQHERNKRHYLGDDVLKSTGSAVVWWLARHENEIERAVDMIGPLAQIAAAANDEEVPELFQHLLVPPAGARNETTVGGSSWDGHDQYGATFGDEEEVGVSERLQLLLAEVGLKPDSDEYTVFVHRVMRSLEAAGLHEAADEIRRSLFPASDDGGAERPRGGWGAEGAAWSPGFPASEGSQFTDTGTFTSEGSESGAGEGNQDGRQTTGDDMTPPPYSWDAWNSPHQSAPTRGRDGGDEDGS
jgi:hypothetical protein